MRIRNLTSEPMVHFLLCGIALFTVHRAILSGDLIGTRITITQGIVDLVTQHVAARGRAPSVAETRQLIDGYLREEIVYREGVALGLDRDDIVVKRRIRQKLEVMVEEEAATAPPTEAELTAYLEANCATVLQRWRRDRAVVVCDQRPCVYGAQLAARTAASAEPVGGAMAAGATCHRRRRGVLAG